MALWISAAIAARRTVAAPSSVLTQAAQNAATSRSAAAAAWPRVGSIPSVAVPSSHVTSEPASELRSRRGTSSRSPSMPATVTSSSRTAYPTALCPTCPHNSRKCGVTGTLMISLATSDHALAEGSRHASGARVADPPFGGAGPRANCEPSPQHRPGHPSGDPPDRVELA